ncbi:hypothetical protein [Aeromonas veronii]|uniref:hypothetical protein n=1 Tax=Aeromonas veronii TaxID=654 RepID=UPI003D1BD68B
MNLKTKSLMQHLPQPRVKQTVEFNAVNGSDAESLAAAELILATRAEISWGSREEDGRKIDLILSCDHPWHQNERMIILSQVKSGSTYGEALIKGFKLKKPAFTSAQRTTHSILMVWVDRDNNKSYWSYIHPNSKSSANIYGSYHEISPATYFDLARCISRQINRPVGGKGVIIRKRTSDFRIRRSNVNNFYKDKKTAFCTVLGEIELTRLGWRHMFRKARASSHKEASLDAIPYIDKILAQNPTEHAITDIKFLEKENYKYRQTEHLLKYSQVELSSVDRGTKIKTTVIIRVLEEIRYPSDWKVTAMLSQKIERRCVLKTIYHKTHS